MLSTRGAAAAAGQAQLAVVGGEGWAASFHVHADAHAAHAYDSRGARLIEYGNDLGLGSGGWDVPNDERVALVSHIGADAGAGLVKDDLGAAVERRNDLRNVLRNA